MGLLDEFENSIDNVRNRIGEIKDKINAEKEMNEDLNKNYSSDEAERDVELERNIFQEFEETEVEIKNILSLEDQEIENLVEKVDKTIEHEEEVKATVISFAETFRDVEGLTQDLENTLTSSQANFDSNIMRQFFEHDPLEIKRKIDRLKEEASSSHQKNSATGVENKLRLCLNETGVVESYSSADITDMPVSLRQLYDQDEENYVYNAARAFNEVLFHLQGENCVSPERYEVLQRDLPKFIDLLEECKEIAQNLSRLLKQEKQINQVLDDELEEAPESIKDLEKIGEEISVLRESLEEEELTAKETEELISQKTGSNHLQASQDVKQEANKVEKNLQNLEQIEQKIAEGVVSLEQKYARITELNDGERENLEYFMREQEDVIQRINKIRKMLRTQKLGFGEEDESREKFREGASIMTADMNSVLSNIINFVRKMETQTQELLNYVESEEEKNMKLEEFESKEIERLENLQEIDLQ